KGPKRRAPPAPQPPGGGKKAKGREEEEEEEEEDAWSSTLAALKTAPKEKSPATIDGLCPLGAQVYEDYDCTLNQTNISANNNKSYIIQLIEHGGAYSTWSRWGRMGEVGQSKLTPFASLEAAKKDFEKKFQEKTKNSWVARESFVAQPGKYTLIEVQPGARQELEVTVRVSRQPRHRPRRRVLPCTLDKATQDLVALIFSSDMFRDAMKTMNIDVKKMPLGKLSKQQITRGFEALEELEAALREQPPRAARLEELSSRFYTIVPHNFGRARPPPIDSPDLLRAKKDMLLVLADIEVAQSLQAQKAEEEEEEVAHPLDQDYALLCCQLSLPDPASREHQLIQNYVVQTGNKARILNIWVVAREGEDKSFKAHDHLEHRRLLWHGTNVAVIAAILKNGLRIMPHLGGRVGRGIYFASENSKSACYVGCTAQRVGIMFLTEVALGKPYRITCDDPTLRQPPAGYDSVLACGRTEPDPAQDEEVLLDGKEVLVCQGKPIPMPAYKESSFSQSEYLIYQESQCRIRYLVQLRF
uniref:Poly [ADP-ribose] polymerase n=1 Tax=Anser brachyrhynchus TaxID=132585 RepID=A0A8B9C8M8_9AVES